MARRELAFGKKTSYVIRSDSESVMKSVARIRLVKTEMVNCSMDIVIAL
jgi:hypothetical protein